jgi:molybdate transport system substrate-binding protein
MKKLSKKALAFVITIILILSMTTVFAAAAPAPTISIDGKALSIASSYGTPYIDSANRVMVPIRVLAENLGHKVDWVQSSQTGIIDNSIRFKLGSYTITTPYGTIRMDTTSVASNGRIYVPVRFLCEALGYDVDYTSANGADIITKVELIISAAASLTESMNELKNLYAASKPNVKLTINYASSGALQSQIEQGAPVDVFFSAASSNMNTLKSKGLLTDSTIKNLLINDIVLVVPNNSTLSLGSFSDAAGDAAKVVAIGDPASVPAGKYGKEAFTYYKVWDAISTKAILGTDVKQVLSWVETGNADCGVVYSTDAASSLKVKVIATAPDVSHTPIVYPAAVIKASTHQAAAADFVNFLSSPAAKALFKQYGFQIA